MKRIFLSVTFILFLVSSLLAQDVVSVMDVFKESRKPNVVIVDARSDAKYKADAHIRNAVHVPYAALQNNTPYHGALKTPEEIAKVLSKNGVTADKKIIVYDGGTGKYAGRLYWILKYMGAKDIKMLNGGLEAWKAKRKPITKNPTMAKKGQFKAALNNTILAKMADVKKGSAVLLDVRSAAEFNGTDGKSKGHIPGSINIEYKEVLDSKGMLKNNADLSTLFGKLGGKNKEIIVFCATSVRAGIVFLALKGAGYTNVKVYDGAYNEWVHAGNKLDK